jgi:hypothetical protein
VVGAFAPFGEGDDFAGDALADAALAATLVGFATGLDAAFGAGLAAAMLTGFGEAF